MSALARVVATLALAAVVPVHAASSQISKVNFMEAGKPFPHPWKKIVGSGHMLLGTRADWRAHLKLARDELGFLGIRGHGLLDDDMSVLPNKNQPPEFYITTSQV